MVKYENFVTDKATNFQIKYLTKKNKECFDEEYRNMVTECNIRKMIL